MSTSSSSSDSSVDYEVIVSFLNHSQRFAEYLTRRDAHTFQLWWKAAERFVECMGRRKGHTSGEEATDSDEENHLVSAAEYGDVDALRLALENYKGNIDDPVKNRETLLHIACIYGHLDCVKFLLEKGSNMEVKDEEGGIPLHYACEAGNFKIVELIISHANEVGSVKRMLDTVDIYGDTPLHNAARCELESEYGDVIRLLVAHGASPTKKNFKGETPLEIADSETEAWRVLKEAVAKD